MSKTIPIWACVLNRALAGLRLHQMQIVPSLVEQSAGSNPPENIGNESSTDCWDCSLHLPLWVSHVERANIESRIEGWVRSLKSTGAELAALAKQLKKPLRPLWISQKTVIWVNQVPDLEDWPFTPVILVSASRPSLFTQRFTDAEFSWSYIPGAADDEESWARGLTPALFWENSRDILSGGPSSCNSKVANIVERNRVYRAMRGHYAPQVRTKCVQFLKEPVTEVENSLSYVNNDHENHCYSSSSKALENKPDEGIQKPATLIQLQVQEKLGSIADSFVTRQLMGGPFSIAERASSGNTPGLHWIGNTGLAVGNADCGNGNAIFKVADCLINCGTSTSLTTISNLDSSLYLPIVGPKFDRHSLQKNLAEAISFARKKLMVKSTILIYCSNGEDISVCVCLAILLSCFNPSGEFEEKLDLTHEVLKKSDVRDRLIYLSSFDSDARPSRRSLRQVFNFFNTRGARDSDLL